MGTTSNSGEQPLFKLIERAEAEAATSVSSKTKAAPRRRAKFPGASFDPELDEPRLTGLQLSVFELMKDGVFRTHGEIKELIGRGSENGIAAMLRGLRSKEHGHHTVNKQRRGDPKSGLWEYQVIPNPRSIRPHA
jgi:hypothetical protein